LLNRTLRQDTYLKALDIKVKENEAILRYSGGDARKLYNVLELVVNAELAEKDLDMENVLREAGTKKIKKTTIVLTDEKVIERVQENIALYDKQGEQHYDIISAFIKSIRGSDPNAAVYWLARMVEGGEDVKFIARRMVILAAEDIGLANPNALLLAQACFDAVNVIGWPESRIILSEAAIYLATSPKSNAAYQAIDKAQGIVNETGDLSVPLHIRNAPTKLMKDLGYGKDYKYAHDFNGNFVKDDFLPDELKNRIFYDPQKNPKEEEIRQRLQKLWKDKYKY
jgi:putative ATPase